MRKKWLMRLMLLAAAAVLGVVALDQRVIIRRYTVESDKVNTPIRLVVLTDLHGGHADGLAEDVRVLQPDAILLVGDMFSADGDAQAELTLLGVLGQIAPAYYVTGNHEYWEYDVAALMTQIAAVGITVLDQSSAELTIGAETITLCGVPDPYAYVDTEAALRRAAEGIHPENFTILLAHRPELVEKYAAVGAFDLVVSGHAHGGQIRLPGIVNGLCAPNQGWFPKYAGGRYEVEGTTMFVSRGLSAQRQMGVPRIFNRPELVLVEIR